MALDAKAAVAERRAALPRGLVDAAYAAEFFDVRSAAIAVMEKRVNLLQRADLPWLIGLVRKSACWAHVDWLATAR